MIPERIGKFEIQGVLGQGAMGQVFLGKDPLLGREVAIKTILAVHAGGEEARARFLREAQAAGRLNHPGIVTVHEFGEDQGLLYLAMERVPGEDLAKLIQQGALTRFEILEAVAQACEALDHAHRHGVIHRDIKPANVMVSRVGGRLAVKLMDFGVARLENSNLTADGTWMGTIGYMAPEYLETGRADAKSDVFAIGVMLFEAISGGRKPFPGETPTMILSRMMKQEPDQLRPEDMEGLPASVELVVTRAMAKDPAKRMGDAGELAKELYEILARPRSVSTAPAPAPENRDQATQMLKKPSSGPLVAKGEVVVGKGGQGQVLSLKVAIRQALPGAIIRVLPGLYREQVVIDKPLTLRGEGPKEAIAIEGLSGPAVQVTGDGVVLENLSLVVGAGAALPEVPAVEVVGGASTYLNCVVESRRGPSMVIGGASTRATLQGVQMGKSPGVGLSVGGGAQAVLDSCQIAQCQGGGIEVGSGGLVQVRGGRLSRCGAAGLLVLEGGQAQADEADFSEIEGSAVQVMRGGNLQLRQCRVRDGKAMGVTVFAGGNATLEGCAISGNGHAGVRILKGATVVLRGCRLHDGKNLGVLCGEEGQGLLEQCELYGNALSGARVERGGSLALIRCVVRDGQDTGLMVLEAGQATLEECVVHRNARGGILLAKTASDPVLRGGRIEDLLLREGPGGQLIRLKEQGSR